MNTTTNKTLPQAFPGKPVVRHSLGALLDNMARRGFDICLSLVGIILLSPFFLLIIILIKRDSAGPVFYKGWRAGKTGRNFKILKFRTMYEREESYQGSKVTAKDDPRITPFGRWLRDTKLNEFPQLWNVLLGEMSLVGPRPEDPAIAENWPEDVRREILSVRPGITSPSSVLYRNEETLLKSKTVMDKYLWDILPSKLRLDQLYVRYRTFLSDLDVIFWTGVCLLPNLGEIKVPEHLLYRGPLYLFIHRYLNWFLIDMLVSFGAVSTAGVIWRLGEPLDIGLGTAVAIALIMALLFSMINALMGLNRIAWSLSRPADALDLALSNGIVTLVLFMLNLLWPNGPLLPPVLVVVSGAFSFSGCVAVRYRSRLITGLATRWIELRGGGLGFVGEHVLIVGSGEVAQFAVWLLRNGNLAQAFSIVGMVDDNPRKVGTQIDGCNVIGTTQDIPALMDKYDVGLILFAISNITPAEQERILTICQSTPSARIILIPDIIDSLRAHFPKQDIDRDAMINKVLRNSTIDRLTGAYNRQQFLKLAESELPRARRYGHPLAVILLAVDYLRPEDVAYVPVIGSQVMLEAAERCRANMRQIDILGRYTENKFAILLPETDELAACFVSERLWNCLTGTPMESDFNSVTISISMGVASMNADIKDAVSLLDLAEKKMEAEMNGARV